MIVSANNNTRDITPIIVCAQRHTKISLVFLRKYCTIHMLIVDRNTLYLHASIILTLTPYGDQTKMAMSLIHL